MDETAMMRQQMNPMAANPAFDAVAAFKGELGAYTQVSSWHQCLCLCLLSCHIGQQQQLLALP